MKQSPATAFILWYLNLGTYKCFTILLFRQYAIVYLNSSNEMFKMKYCLNNDDVASGTVHE